MRCIEILNTFISKDNKEPLVCARPMAVYARDLATGAEGLWWPDNVPGAGDERIGPAREGQRGGGKLVPALGEKRESRTSGVHHSLVVLDTKGKVAETPSSKPQRKRKIKASVEGLKEERITSTISPLG